MSLDHLKKDDIDLYNAIVNEGDRQEDHIELIASENFVSEAVMEAQGSKLTNKYAEGYPGKRYYGGCEFVDVVEDLARDRAKEIFGADHVNVQTHSGAQANMAIYFSILEPGDTVLGMNLSHGGHLTHGASVNFSGKLYNFEEYGVDKDTELLNYDLVREKALEVKPKLIVAGASAYPREIDFKKFREIADEVGAYLLVDMAHIAGLVAAGLHQNPVQHAHFVTTTTHKTLRGPRGGMVLCEAQFAKKVDSVVFPGMQGGPLMHVIAAKATAFKEALTDDFKVYSKKVIDHARSFAKALEAEGIRVVSGGTDNHIVLIDVSTLGITGATAELALDEVGLTTNKNTIPYDKEGAFVTSGIRMGTGAATTRGFDAAAFDEIAKLIGNILKNLDDQEVKEDAKARVKALTSKFPLYKK